MITRGIAMTGPTEADRQKSREMLWDMGEDTETQLVEKIAQALCEVRDEERKRIISRLSDLITWDEELDEDSGSPFFSAYIAGNGFAECATSQNARIAAERLRARIAREIEEGR